MHKRKAIRAEFVRLLSLGVAAEVVANRTHSVSRYPTVNLISSTDEADIEAHTAQTQGREYVLIARIHVASTAHDDDTDDIIDAINAVVSANRTSAGLWRYCRLGDIDAPDDEAGEVDYAITDVAIAFTYEVSQ